MNDSSAYNQTANRADSGNFPPWADCDYFCIHDYAAAGAAPCGWRGRIQDALRDAAGAKLVCPRCGCATLLRIPADDGHFEAR